MIEPRGGRWRVRLRRHGRDASATFDTYADARAWEASFLAAVANGSPPPGRPRTLAFQALTVTEAARDYISGAVEGKVLTRSQRPYAPSTIRSQENVLRRWVLPRIGRVPITALGRGDVLRMLEALVVEASPQTARNARDALRVVLQRQVDLEVIVANPAAGLRRAGGSEHRPIFLTVEQADQVQELADAHPHPCIGVMVALGLGTGARPGEIAAAAWGPTGVDLDRRVLVVSGTLDRTGIGPPKSRRVREVPLGPELVSRLRRYRMASPRSADGERVIYRSTRRSWEQVRAALGMPELRAHDLRHTAATHWLAAGLSVHAVAELLGHTTAALVLRLYGHALPSELASAGDRLEAWKAAHLGRVSQDRP